MSAVPFQWPAPGVGHSGPMSSAPSSRSDVSTFHACSGSSCSSRAHAGRKVDRRDREVAEDHGALALGVDAHDLMARRVRAGVLDRHGGCQLLAIAGRADRPERAQLAEDRPRIGVGMLLRVDRVELALRQQHRRVREERCPRPIRLTPREHPDAVDVRRDRVRDALAREASVSQQRGERLLVRRRVVLVAQDAVGGERRDRPRSAPHRSRRPTPQRPRPRRPHPPTPAPPTPPKQPHQQ